jgi:hypothetical protein
MAAKPLARPQREQEPALADVLAEEIAERLDRYALRREKRLEMLDPRRARHARQVAIALRQAAFRLHDVRSAEEHRRCVHAMTDLMEEARAMILEDRPFLQMGIDSPPTEEATRAA